MIYRFFARYADEDVLVLLLLLRISVILNKSRQATDSTDKINLRIDRSLQTWELTFEKHYLDNNPLVWNELRLESNLLKDLELSLILTDKIGAFMPLFFILLQQQAINIGEIITLLGFGNFLRNKRKQILVNFQNIRENDRTLDKVRLN